MNRRTVILATASIMAAVFSIAGIVCWFAFQDHATTDHLIVRWRSIGKPMRVEGTVFSSRQAPLKGISIHVEDDSGGQSATTDENGRFAVQLGEAEVRGFELKGYGGMNWGILGFGGLDATKGLELTITVRH
jgi:hypothetical protein